MIQAIAQQREAIGHHAPLLDNLRQRLIVGLRVWLSQHARSLPQLSGGIIEHWQPLAPDGRCFRRTNAVGGEVIAIPLPQDHRGTEERP
jgi:hypothetical protein